MVGGRDRAFALVRIVDEVFPIERQDVRRVATIVEGKARQSARGALHTAVMEQYGIETVFSFDRGYDRWPGLAQFQPCSHAAASGPGRVCSVRRRCLQGVRT